jgi:fucose 4-O-acetylase-like acetyltransferase
MPAPDTKIQRMFYIDNIRWLMIIFVIVNHADVIYGPVGQFFGVEYRSEELGVPDILLAMISIVFQTFFMGLLFLISGYFVTNSLARKGQKKFVWDRFKRLGIPAIIFMLVIAPSIDYPLWGEDEMSFADWALRYYPNPWNWDSGPMWFAIALLIFCIAWTFKPEGWTLDRFRGPLTRSRVAIIMALAVVGTFLVRIPFPMETDVWNMQLCFFTQYVLLFVVGIIAYKNDWLSTLSKKDGRFYMLVAVVMFLAVFMPLLVAGGALEGDLTPFNGGLHWQAFGYAFFEQVFGISVCMWLLIWFRERYNRQGWLEKKLSDNAFAVYMFHPPVVIGLAILLAGYDLPGFLKFVMVAVAATIITFSLAELVLRRIPLLKKVL